MTDTRNQIQQLKEKLADFSEDLASLEKLLGVDVPGSLNKIRFITEKVLHTMCVRRGVSWGEKEPTLENMIGPLTSKGVIPKDMASLVRTIQTTASPGSHYQIHPLSQTHVTIAQTALIEFLEWYFSTFEGGPGVIKDPTQRSASPAADERSKAVTSSEWKPLRMPKFGCTVAITVACMVGVVTVIGLREMYHGPDIPPSRTHLLT